MDVADAVPPIALGMGGLPFVPNAQRLYFHFGKPIRTDGFTPAEVAVRDPFNRKRKRWTGQG